MSSVSDRLSALFSQIEKSEIDDGAIAIAELRSLLKSVANPYQREKIDEALTWANILFGAQSLEKWGGEEGMRGRLLQSIYKAMSARKPAHDLN